MFPIVGSGRYITAPVVTEDGTPIQDPLVLLEANPQSGLALPPQDNVDAEGSEPSTSNSSETKKQLNQPPLVDKKEIQWKLTLHQIGW